MPPTVITGLCDAMSLCMVRSLGKKGIPVTGVDSNISTPFAKSKYCRAVKCDSLFDSTLIDSLLDCAASSPEKAVLINCTDQSVLNVSENRDKLQPHYYFVLPPHSTILQLISKRLFYDFALANNILVPPTFFSTTVDELEAIANTIKYPCIIKPEFRTKHWLEHVPNKVLYASSQRDLLRQTLDYDVHETSLVLQEWIDGDDSSLYFCLAYIGANHEPLMLFTGRKLRQHPHLAGTLTVSESVWVPEIADETVRMFQTSGVTGFCSVEYKCSTADGKFYAIEPTIGRPDSQEQMCVSAGLDVPFLAYRDALGEEVRPLGRFQEGLKWIDEPRAYYTVLEYLNGAITLNQLISIFKGPRSYALCSRQDPMPGLSFFWGVAKGSGNKLARRTSRLRFDRQPAAKASLT